MKKFQFSLETVLDYKQQVLDALRTEHGAILAQVRAQEELLERLDGEYRQLDQDFTQRKMEGMTVLDALAFEQCLRAMEAKIRRETQVLEELRQKEEAKRAEVVVAKQDTSALEKLREKKLDNYNKMVQKAEESMIDELVSTKRAMAAQSA